MNRIQNNAERVARDGDEVVIGDLTVQFFKDSVRFIVANNGVTETNDPIKLAALRNRISMWQAARREREKSGPSHKKDSAAKRSATD